MIPKLILVLYLITGRNGVTMQYIVRFPTEAACQVEAKRLTSTSWGYPIQKAECVFDASAKGAP